METQTKTDMPVFYSIPKISDRDIISDDHQSELILIREITSMNCLRIGDIANYYIVGNAEMSTRVSADRVFEAVGRFVGKEPRTIRHYAALAAYFSPETRKRYEILPISFLSFAKSQGEGEWQKILDFAMLRPYMTLAQLRENYFEDPELPYNAIMPESPETLQRLPTRELSSDSRMNSGSLSTDAKKSEPTATRRFASIILLTTLTELVEKAIRLTGSVVLPEPLRETLDTHLSGLRKILPLVASIAKDEENP